MPDDLQIESQTEDAGLGRTIDWTQQSGLPATQLPSALPEYQDQPPQTAQTERKIDWTKPVSNFENRKIDWAPFKPEAEPAETEAESGVATALRAFGSDIVPATGSLVGALGAGAAAIESGPGAIAAAIAGRTAGYSAGEYAKKKVMGDEAYAANIEQMKKNAEEHPYWDAAGRAIPLIMSLGGGGGVVSSISKKAASDAIAKGATELEAKAASVAAAKAASGKYLTKVGESAAIGLGVGASTVAGEAVGGKDVTVGDFADAMAKDAIAFGALGMLPHMEGLIKQVGMAVPQALTMELANSAYDSIVHDKPFEPAEIIKRGGAEVIPFAIFNVISHGVSAGRQRLAANPEEKAKVEAAAGKVPPPPPGVATAESREIDPATAYKADAEQKSKITELVSKELGSRMEDEDAAALSQIRSDPSRGVEYQFYLMEKQRQQAEAAKSPAPTPTTAAPEVKAAPATPEAAQAPAPAAPAAPAPAAAAKPAGEPKKAISLLSTPSGEIINAAPKGDIDQRLQHLKDVGLLVPFDFGKGETVASEASDRVHVVVNIDGTNVPFYLSTGLAGKKLTKSGHWYPTLGIHPESGWINKGSDEQLSKYYDNPAFAKAAKILDSVIGDISGLEESNNYKSAWGREEKAMANAINSKADITAVPNGPEAIKGLRESLKKIYDKMSKAAPAAVTPAAPTPVIEPARLEEARKKAAKAEVPEEPEEPELPGEEEPTVDEEALLNQQAAAEAKKAAPIAAAAAPEAPAAAQEAPPAAPKPPEPAVVEAAAEKPPETAPAAAEKVSVDQLVDKIQGQLAAVEGREIVTTGVTVAEKQAAKGESGATSKALEAVQTDSPVSAFLAKKFGWEDVLTKIGYAMKGATWRYNKPETEKSDPKEAVDKFQARLNELSGSVKYGEKAGVKQVGVGQRKTKGYQDVSTMSEEEAKEEIYKDSKAKSGTSTKKLAAFETPSGVIVIGQVFKSPTKGKLVERVKILDENDKPKTVNYDDLVKDHIPIASFHLGDYSKDFAAHFSKDEFRDLVKKAKKKEISQGKSFEVIQQQLNAQAVENGKKPVDRDDAELAVIYSNLSSVDKKAVDEKAAQNLKISGTQDPDLIPSRTEEVELEAQPETEARFDPKEHGEAIYEALKEAKVNSLESAFKAIEKLLLSGNVKELSLLAGDLGLLDAVSKTQERYGASSKEAVLAYKEAVSFLSKFIYDTYSGSSKSGVAFVKSLTKSINSQIRNLKAGREGEDGVRTAGAAEPGAVAGAGGEAARAGGVPEKAKRGGEKPEPDKAKAASVPDSESVKRELEEFAKLIKQVKAEMPKAEFDTWLKAYVDIFLNSEAAEDTKSKIRENASNLEPWLKRYLPKKEAKSKGKLEEEPEEEEGAEEGPEEEAEPEEPASKAPEPAKAKPVEAKAEAAKAAPANFQEIESLPEDKKLAVEVAVAELLESYRLGDKEDSEGLDGESHRINAWDTLSDAGISLTRFDWIVRHIVDLIKNGTYKNFNEALKKETEREKRWEAEDKIYEEQRKAEAEAEKKAAESKAAKAAEPAKTEPAPKIAAPVPATPVEAKSKADLLVDSWVAGIDKINAIKDPKERLSVLGRYLAEIRDIYAVNKGEPYKEEAWRKFEKLFNKEVRNRAEVYEPKPLPKLTESKLSEGVKSLLGILSRVHRKIGIDQIMPKNGTERFKLNKLLAKAEVADIEKLVKDNPSLMLDSKDFAKKWDSFGKEAEKEGGEEGANEGGEHLVYEKDGYFYKAYKGVSEGGADAEIGTNLFEYLKRIALHNELFPSTKYEFLGFVRDPRMLGADKKEGSGERFGITLEGFKDEQFYGLEATRKLAEDFVKGLQKLHPGKKIEIVDRKASAELLPVVRQRSVLPIIKTEIVDGKRKPVGVTREMVAAEMAKRGYRKFPDEAHRPNDYYNPKDGLLVEDLHAENVYIRKNGELIFTDPIISQPHPEDYNKAKKSVYNFITGKEIVFASGPLRYWDPPMTRQRAESYINSQRMPDEKAIKIFAAIAESLRNRGIDVSFLSQEVAKMGADCGEFVIWKDSKGNIYKSIVVAMGDSINPDYISTITLLHEAGHAVFAGESLETQALLHKAIERATNEFLGINENFVEYTTETGEKARGIRQEGRLAESIAEKLAEEGFNPDDCKDIVSKMSFAIQALYNRVVMGMMSTLGYEPSTERALAYFEARTKSFMAGGRMVGALEAGLKTYGHFEQSLSSFLGGVKHAQVDYNSPEAFVAGPSGQISAVPAGQESRYRMPTHVYDSQPDISPDIDNATVHQHKFAAHAEVSDAISKIMDAATAEGLVPKGITKAEFTRFLELPEGPDAYDYGSTPDSIIEGSNNGIKVLGQIPVNPNNKVADIKGTEYRMQAAEMARNILAKTKSFWASKGREARSELNRKSNEIIRVKRNLAKALENYQDLELLYTFSKSRMRELISDTVVDADVIEDAASELSGASRKIGELNQVLRDLSSDIKGDRIPQRYLDALNKLNKGLGDGTIDLSDTMQALADVMEYQDWHTMSSNEILDHLKSVNLDEINNGELLKPLIQATPEARVRLATAVSFAKSEAHMMNLMSLRQIDVAGDREEYLNELRKSNEIIKKAVEKNYGAMDAAKAEAEKLPKLGAKMAKLLDSLSKLKTKHRAILDSIENNRKYSEIQQIADPMIDRISAPLEAMVGFMHVDFKPINGASVFIPETTDARPEKFVEKKLDLRVDGTTSPEVASYLGKMSDWLKLGPNFEPNQELLNKYGSRYLQIKQQFERLQSAQIEHGIHRSIQNGFVTRMLAPVTEKLRAVGTPTSRAAAAMIEKSQVLWRSVRDEVYERGHIWENRAQDAARALGIRRQDVFNKVILNDVCNHLENRKDLQAKYADDKTAVNEAVDSAMQYLMLDVGTKKKMETPGAREAVEKWLKYHIESNGFISRHGTRIGLKVSTGAPGKASYRDPIGSSAYTFARGLSDAAEAMFLKMVGTDKEVGPWAGKPINAKEAAALSRSGALESVMAPKFTPEIWSWFARTICSGKKGISAFYAPAEAGQMKSFASRENVKTAFEASGGDAVKFAEALYYLHPADTRGDIHEFVGETMHTFQGYFDLLSAMRGDHEDFQDKGSPSPRRFIMDARKCEAAPSEWYDYMPLDKTTMSQVTRSQCYHSAFGRRMETMRLNLRTAMLEQDAMMKQYEDLKMDFPGLEGVKLKKAMMSEMKARGWKNPVAFEMAAKNLYLLKSSGETFEAILSMNRNRPPEASVMAELMGALSGLTVSGPATALTDFVSVVEQPWRKFGFNVTAAKFAAGGSKDVLKVAADSLLQMVNLHIAQDAWRTKLAMRVGIRDESATMSRKDKWQSVFASRIYAENPIARGAAITSRIAKNLLSAGTTRLPGFGEVAPGEATAPTFKPLSPFQWMAQCAHLGMFNRWSRTYESAVMAVIDHFERNPEDLANPDFKIDAKLIGFPEGRAFEYIKQSMARFGSGTFEQLARDAIQRRSIDSTAPILSDDFYRQVVQQSLEESTMDSSLTTRPTWLVDNNLGQLANPMLGWAIHKSYDAWRGFRAPDGQRSMKSFVSGLLPYAAILPVGLAFAYLRGKFDEDIMGKKSNVRDITSAHDAKSAFLTVIENSARIGTFGVAGEFPNYWFNQDSGTRPVSVDGRVFLINTLMSTQNAIMNLAHQRNLDYATTVRPFISAFGGNGFLQSIAVINNIASLDNAEARVSNRISINNYLRTAGRAADLNVRPMNGVMQAAGAADPMRPHIGKMVMAAYANNASDFRESYNSAIKEAIVKVNEDPAMRGKDRMAEAKRVVKERYASQSPMRIVFQSTPTEAQYRNMLRQMDEQGRKAVTSAVNFYNHYGNQIGGAHVTFKKSAPSVFGLGASGMTQSQIRDLSAF